METISLDTETLKLANLLWPWVVILFSLVVTFWVKDLAVKIAKGLSFKMNKAFNEGDEVLIDGKKAIIVKIGITQTVFGVYSPSGYTWRYVPNERISWIKLEKIVNPDLKISKNMLKIDSNSKEIKELKKKINGTRSNGK